MKKAYTKPELYTVEYATNTGFCGACSDQYEEWADFFEWPAGQFSSAFINDADGCSYHIENHEGYCKYTASSKIFTS